MFYYLCSIFALFFPVILFLGDLKNAKVYKIIIAMLIPVLEIAALAIWKYNLILTIFGFEFNVNLSLNITISYIADVILFKQKPSFKNVLAILAFFGAEIASRALVCAFTDATLLKLNQFFEYDYLSDIYIVIFFLIFWSAASLLHFVDYKNRRSLTVYLIIAALIFFLSFFLIFMQSFSQVSKDSEDYYLFNIAFNISFTIIIIFIMFILIYYSTELVKKERMLQEKIKEDVNAYYSKALLLSQEELIKIRHDIKNCLQIAKLNDENLYNQLKERMGTFDQVYYGKEPTLNKVLLVKCNEARNEGISFEANTNALEYLPMTELDIISLFSNILDNAIRSATMCEDKFIKLEILHEDKTIFIHLANSCLGIVKKKDQIFHGKGSDIINDIVNKYHGKWTRKITGSIFITDIELDFKEEVK